ncbi:hypothetical protein MHU86_12937 [Fragilaria crotonensis]|nr:hypothetical protein MHU86_12937 [Fragilaria crotonensis]
MRPTRQRNVAPGAYPISSDSNTATRRAPLIPIGAYGSTIVFLDEFKAEDGLPISSESGLRVVESKEEEGMPSSAESGLYIVEGHRVPDVDEKGATVVAEVHHVTIKWYQRPFIDGFLLEVLFLAVGLLWW